MRNLLTLLFLSFFAFAITSCGDSTTTSEEEGSVLEEQPAEAEPSEAAPAEVDKSGPEYTSAYICPMHCPGSGSAEPGVCPACGMDYVMNEEMEGGESHDGHDHSEGDHSGHNH